GYSEALVPDLEKLLDNENDSDRWIHAACALSAYNSTNPRWKRLVPEFTEKLVKAPPQTAFKWSANLIGTGLSGDKIRCLVEIMPDRHRRESERLLAANLMSWEAVTTIGPNRLELTLDAEGALYERLRFLARLRPEENADLLHMRLDKGFQPDASEDETR